MRVSREQAAANRERIIDAAAALFRAKGFDGIGVADIMKAADLTHGGFYGHFASKDDLVAQASRRTHGALGGELGARGGRSARPSLRSAVAALSDAAPPRRSGSRLRLCGAQQRRRAQRQDGARCLRRRPGALIDILAQSVPGRTKAIRRRKAVAAMAGLVGALSLARAVGDPRLVGRNYRRREARVVGGRGALERYSLTAAAWPLFPKCS